MGSIMNREEIEQWLTKYNIHKYTIRENLVVDVSCNVIITYNPQLTKLPFQFGTLAGNFYCFGNNLTSLQHCPTSVRGDFYCANNKLISLQYCPTTVCGNFNCAKNKLTSLRYFPTTIGGDSYCYGNPFTVTEENEREWMEVIKNNKDIYFLIKKPTDSLTAFYKMIWEV